MAESVLTAQLGVKNKGKIRTASRPLFSNYYKNANVFIFKKDAFRKQRRKLKKT